MSIRTVSAADLCLSILWNDFHRPFIDGKANRQSIEEAITVGMMSKQLGYVDQETVDIAIDLVNDLILQYKN
jgi:hypothetical protein